MFTRKKKYILKNITVALAAFICSFGTANATVGVSWLDGSTTGVNLHNEVPDLDIANTGVPGTPNGYIGWDAGETWGMGFTVNRDNYHLKEIYIGIDGFNHTSTLTLTIDEGNNGSNDHTFAGLAVPGLTVYGGQTGNWSYLKFDLSTENILLAAGQHNFVFRMDSEAGGGGPADPAMLLGYRSTYGGGSIITNTAASQDAIFGIVPEPTTYALIFGGLSLAYVMFRRRFKG